MQVFVLDSNKPVHGSSCICPLIKFFCLSYLKSLCLFSGVCFFAGLIRQTAVLFWKFSLWSFCDMRQLIPPFACLFFKAFQKYFQIPVALIFFLMLLLAFLYLAVIESFSILSYSFLVKRQIFVALSDNAIVLFWPWQRSG